MVSPAQTKINVPFPIKKGETIEVAQLKIKYLGEEKEWTGGWDSQGKRLEINYTRYDFEVEKDGKKTQFKEVFYFKVDDLVIEILGMHFPENLENASPEAIKIVVKTNEQFEKDKQKQLEISDCQVIRTVYLPLTKKPGVKTESKISLLNTCLNDKIPQQRPTTEVVRNGKKLFRTFEIIKVFADRAEAEKYAKENGITDVDFGIQSEIGKIDDELTQSFHNLMQGGISHENADKFTEILEEKLKNPITFENTLPNLEHKISIVASPDKRLKFYSWDNRTGGTWHNMSVIAQYKDEKGIIRVKELNNSNLDELPDQTDFVILKIYEIKVKNQTQYLTIGWGTHGGGHQFDIVKTFRIKDSLLITDSSILPQKRDLIITYPRMMKSDLSFDPTTNQISYQEFIEDKDSGFMQPTGKIITLKLMNGRFRR